MTALSDLNFADAPLRRSVPSIDMAVDKFVKAVLEQIACFKAVKKGEEFTVERVRYSGKGDERTKTIVNVPLRRWWNETDDGQVYIALRYGNRPLEIVDGKHTVLVPKMADVIPTLEMVLVAAKKGELDRNIATARNKGKKSK